MTDPNILKLPAADMTIQQHAAINLMIPSSGCEVLDQMIWEAKRDHVATQIMKAMVSSDSVRPRFSQEDLSAKAYESADVFLAQSGWDQGGDA